MWAKLPESEAYLRAVERRDDSGTLARSAAVVKGRYLRDQYRAVRGVVHGPAARLRAEHLAADDHARRRLFDSAGHHA